MEDIKLIFSKNLISLRKSISYTQAELALELNYSDKSVSKWERGESIPDVTILKQMAAFFGVTIDYLVSEHNDNEMVTPNVQVSEDLKQIRKNHFFITLVSIVGIFLAALVIYIIFNQVGLNSEAFPNWMLFICALPASLTTAFVLACIWGFKYQRFMLLSGLCWSILLLAYLITKIWLLFIIGAPAQIIIILSYGIKIKSILKKDSKN